MKIKSNWSKQIQNARKAKGLTQRDLAKKIDVTETAIKQFENSINLPSYETVLKICEVLDTTWDDIFAFELKNNDYATIMQLFNKGIREIFSVIETKKGLTMNQSACTNMWYADLCYDLMYFNNGQLSGATKIAIPELLNYSHQLKKKFREKYNKAMTDYIVKKIDSDTKKKPD